MTRITVELDEEKSNLLREKAQRYGLSADQFVAASIEDLLGQPDTQSGEAVRKVLSKNKDVCRRLA